MTATATANLSVGPPYDIGIYRSGSHELQHARIEGDSPFLARLSDTWRDHLMAAVHALPEIEPGDVAVFDPDVSPS